MLFRSQLNKPILLLATPLPSENGLLDQMKPNMEPWRTAAETSEAVALMGHYEEVAAGVTAMGITLVPQAAETRATEISTMQRFAENAPRSNSEEIRPDEDHQHMNIDYGIIMWSEIKRALAGHGLVPAPGTSG